jgi:nucleoid DNA-binding protein
MRAKRWLVVGALAGVAGLFLGFGGEAYPQRQAPQGTLQQELAKKAQVKQALAARFLAALGPVVTAQLQQGGTVTLPGLGVFRVVRVPEHRDLGPGGRPVLVPGRNYVEFAPASGLNQATNDSGVKAAVTVQPFEFIPDRNQAPSQRTRKIRATGTTRAP